jgi:hypothetical protein
MHCETRLVFAGFASIIPVLSVLYALKTMQDWSTHPLVRRNVFPARHITAAGFLRWVVQNNVSTILVLNLSWR